MDNDKGMLTFMMEPDHGQFEVSGVPVRAYEKPVLVRVNLATGEILTDGTVEIPGDEKCPTVRRDGPSRITWDAKEERLLFDPGE